MILKPCPFCGWCPATELDIPDSLYPSGKWWADSRYYGDVIRTYRRHAERQPGDKPCWVMRCNDNAGGCGASIEGDSEDEVVAKWNRRVETEAAK